MASSALAIGHHSSGTFDLVVRESVRTAIATIELHDYQFHGPQFSEHCFGRSFLDLALSPRPGPPRGRFIDAPVCGARAMGPVIFMPAGTRLRSEWGAGPQRSICLEFNDARSGGEGWSEHERARSLDVRSHFVNDALVRLAHELIAPSFESTLMIEALCIQLGIELGRYFRSGRDAEIADCTSRLSASQLRLVEGWIDLPGPLPSIVELARECGISARSFFRSFRATTGMTLSDYAARRRMARAQASLASATVPIKQVAWECGFATPAAFSAAFRRATGFRPRDYRLMAKG